MIYVYVLIYIKNKNDISIVDKEIPCTRQVLSEHEQAPTPQKSFSSISEVSMTFCSIPYKS